MHSLDLDQLDFGKGGGTVTVVTQDARSGAVLMVAHADREALERSIATGEMHYRSRARGLWHKGATSGNVQRLLSLSADCDGDAVLARVVMTGPSCHTGDRSCFGSAALAADSLGELAQTIDGRAADLNDPQAVGSTPSYTRCLLTDRNLRLKKLGEEAAELITACADGDAARAVAEAADLMYHSLVALCAVGMSLPDVQKELAGRARTRSAPPKPE